MYVSGMDPYDEAQHILEVLQRNSSTGSVKCISEDEAVIQIEQQSRGDAQTVLNELVLRGYKVVSKLTPIAGGWTAGIKKERTREVRENESRGFEPGD